jgi:hypothetical protein
VTRPDGVGGQVGINQQIGGIVLGGELALSGTEMHETLTPAAFALVRFKTSVSDLLTVTGRAGKIDAHPESGTVGQRQSGEADHGRDD